MRTILKQFILGSFLIAAFAASSLVVSAQTADPCVGAVEAYKEWSEVLYSKKDIPGREMAIEKGKEFVTKYPDCKDQEDGYKFIKDNLPTLEKNLAAVKRSDEKKKQTAKFLDGMKASRWEDVYAAGKFLLAEYPDEMRDAKLVLATVGYDETRKSATNTKWNDETIKYAKEVISDLEANKVFKNWGVNPGANPIVYKGKDDVLGWMNYYIGYLNAYDKKNKREGATYMFKASQIPGEASADPIPYAAIGQFLVEQLNEEIKKLKALPAIVDADTPEIKTQKEEALKAQAGLMKGTADRALDAYARAYAKAGETPALKAYKEGVLKAYKEIYFIRYDKADGADVMIKAPLTKSLLNPTAPIVSVSDVTPAAGTGPAGTKPVTAPGTKTVPAKNPATAPVTKPATVVKPAAAKPGASVAKKKATR